MLFYKSILGKRIPYGLFACGPLAGPLPSMGGRKLYWSQIGSSKLSLSLSLSLSPSLFASQLSFQLSTLSSLIGCHYLYSSSCRDVIISTLYLVIFLAQKPTLTKPRIRILSDFFQQSQWYSRFPKKWCVTYAVIIYISNKSKYLKTEMRYATAEKTNLYNYESFFLNMRVSFKQIFYISYTL